LETTESGGYAMGKMGFTSIMTRLSANADACGMQNVLIFQQSNASNPIIRWFENRTWTEDAAGDLRAIQRGLNASGSYFKHKLRTLKQTVK